MTRSEQQPVDLDREDVEIDIPTTARLLSELRQPKRIPINWGVLLSTLAFFPMAALCAYGVSPNYRMAACLTFVGTVSLFLQTLGRQWEQQRERDRITAELLEELVVQNNQQHRDLERLARALKAAPVAAEHR